MCLCGGIQANSASLRGKFASQKLPPPYGKAVQFVKNPTVLFTFGKFYGIIALVDVSGRSYTQNMLNDIIDLVYESTGETIVRFICDSLGGLVMRLVCLMGTTGRYHVVSGIGYGDFVYSFFSTVSYHLEGRGNWGKRFPRLLLDLCDGGLIKNENIDELENELNIIYNELQKMPISDVVYDLEDLSKPMPNDLLPTADENVTNLAQLWVTPRKAKVYLEAFGEIIDTVKDRGGSLALGDLPETTDKQLFTRPKDKGRKYWLDMVPINYG